jgi:hypothetical protein
MTHRPFVMVSLVSAWFNFLYWSSTLNGVHFSHDHALRINANDAPVICKPSLVSFWRNFYCWSFALDGG